MTDFGASADERHMAAETLERPPFGATEAASAPLGDVRIEAVYAEHFRYVWRCLRALGVSDALLDDAVHDVFVVVQQKLATFDGAAPITTWLYAIALRVARRYRLKARRDAWRFAPEADAGVDGEDANPHAAAATANAEQTLEHGERLELARRALDRLDDDKREAFVLSQVEQKSAPEIAEILGVPVNTVYSRVRAAKLAFQAAIARQELVTRGKTR